MQAYNNKQMNVYATFSHYLYQPINSQCGIMEAIKRVIYYLYIKEFRIGHYLIWS